MAIIQHEVKGEIRVIVIDTARLLDDATIEQCYREILDALAKTEESNVLLHFGRVTFMSSSALGMLLRVNKKCKEYKVMLKLCNVAPDIRKVFKITNLDKVLELHDDPAQALEAFKKSGQLFYRKRKPTSHEVLEK
jgi:anti-anti-sigma factor